MVSRLARMSNPQNEGLEVFRGNLCKNLVDIAPLGKVQRETLSMAVRFYVEYSQDERFIKYNGTMEVHSSLLNVILHD